MTRFARFRASFAMVLALVLGGSSAYAMGPTGNPVKDNPNFGRPWLKGYSTGYSTGSSHRVVHPHVQYQYVPTQRVNTGHVTLGPYFKAADGNYYSLGSNGRYYRYTAAGWVLH